MFQWLVLLFLTINLGMGGALTLVMIALAVFFKGLSREEVVTV